MAFGAIIGAALGAAGSIYGGIQSSRANRKIRKELKKEEQENENWYNRRYNEDATQRADAQAMLTAVGDSIRNRNRNAAGTQAVIGGTDESVQATREANNEALASTASTIAANQSARKDSIEQQYMETKQDIRKERAGLNAQRANNIATATQGVTNAAGNLAVALDSNSVDNYLDQQTQK